MARWANDTVVEVATGRTWRVLERYLFPGKNTGFVLVCSNRACFTEIRSYRQPLGRLPHGVSPEDRSAVVAWAVKRREEQTQDAFRCAVTGEKPAKALDDVDGPVV